MTTARVSSLSAAFAAACLASIIIGFVATLAFVGEARAASYVVTSSGDAHDARPGDKRCATSSGQCTLRAAIEEANASQDPDIIGFRLERAATITLHRGQLEIAGAATVTIQGPGAGLLSLDGNAASRVIRVAPDATAYISGITLRNGSVDRNKFGDRAFGAGLENAGVATLRNVVIRGNRAPQGGGGIVNGGQLSLIASTVSGNSAQGFAGGILNTGSLLLVDSSVSGNGAADGAGGIDNRGMASLINSAVNGNTSKTQPGGIVSRGPLRLIGSTVKGNNGGAGAGGIENFASLSIFLSTVTGNRSTRAGGIAGTLGEISISRSQVTGNSSLADVNADCLISPISKFHSGGRNRFGKGTGCTAIAQDSAIAAKSPAVAASTVALNIRVAASTDDAEESSSGSVNLTSGDLELVHEATDQKVGMRFRSVTVPKGATISNAWIQFTADEAQSESTSLLFQGQAADNGPSFTTTSGNVSSRPRTTAGVSWNSVASWTTIGQAGSAQQTPNLATVVQEIVNRAGWASGNAVVIVVTGSGHRTARSYNGGSSTAPLLHIEYTSTTTTVNQAPIVNAGPDLTITLPAGASLAGSRSDDGLPNPPATVTCGWTTASGPAQAVFANPASPSTTATFTASGTYRVRLTCSDSLLSAFDEAQITVNPTGGGGGANVAVYAGYYDTHHPAHLMPKPNPWQGASNTVFVGAPNSASGGWDSSAVRVDNLTSSTLTGVTVTVDIGSSRFALWGQQSIPAGGSLVLAQTGSGKFDGSDRNSAGCWDCAASLCTTAISSTIPVVHVTVGGTTINVPDSGQLLNTRGVNSAGCPFYGHGIRSDESESWLQIH